ncbi:MAG: TMEM175 family protein [Alphaproteobacteria bacterium]
MNTSRLEAFSDGVIAIIITIMVLEMKVPHGAGGRDLLPLIPVFLSYVLSFIYLAIYWNNHHHMFQAAQHVNGMVLWANAHLLFWLSLIPFVTGWMGENNFAPLPTAFYGFVLFMCAIAYLLLQKAILRGDGSGSLLAKAVGKKDIKGMISPLIYLIAMLAAFYDEWISQILYVLVALMWLLPDRRIEKILIEIEND